MVMHFSIVIPTYNRAEYISICCKAIKDQIQNKKGSEVIIVDDGSDQKIAQKNADICKQYGFTYVYQNNRGMAVARNTGINNSMGKWIIFLDDDVLIDSQWYKTTERILTDLPESVVGIEGMVEGYGDGLWDREVQNLKGGAFLTCHLAVRRSVLNDISGFDETFEVLGPYCEDHELAVRLLNKGRVLFNSDMKVTHLQRDVKLGKYILNAPVRIQRLLRADSYFYLKHPDQYHLFRHAKTFWGTYRSILFKNVYKCVRRRSLSRILNNPIQFITLITAALVEQIYAWLILVSVINQYHNLLLSNSKKKKKSSNSDC